MLECTHKLLDRFLDDLRALLLLQWDVTPAQERLKQLSTHAALQENELAQALFALNCHHAGIAIPPLKIEQTPKGAVLLFRKGLFPWGALPYPREHAEMGAVLLILAKAKNDSQLLRQVLKMGDWQLLSLDHSGFPIHALFLQEGSHAWEELLLANYFFFRLLSDEDSRFLPIAKKQWEALGNLPLKSTVFMQLVLKFPLSSTDEKKIGTLPSVEDPFIGMLGERYADATILSLGAGCKSGMGMYLLADTGIINFGPQKRPFDNCQTFGLGGSHEHLQRGSFPLELEKRANGYRMAFKTRLSGMSLREATLFSLKDSGYTGLWIEGEQVLENKKLSVNCAFEGFTPLKEMAFVFYAKGSSCIVNGSQKLKPRSLDRYVGPASKVEVQGVKDKVVLFCSMENQTAEIIPLAGSGNFWGADFLIAFPLDSFHSHYSWQLEGG